MITTRRIAAVSLAGGLLAVVPFSMPAAQAAPPSDCPAYSVTTTTNTSLSLTPPHPVAGQGFTVRASVTSAGARVSGGTVSFSYAGTTKTDAVHGGRATAKFVVPASGGATLTASYTGVCLAGQVAVGTSGSAMVAGVEASAGGGSNNGNGNGRVGGVSGSNGDVNGIVGGVSGNGGALPNTGLDTQTELLGALGLGLVGAGALTMVVRRRRVTA
jgi:LPXTG-motif cell wall-anchored protein